jgi:hypothetical protein
LTPPHDAVEGWARDGEVCADVAARRNAQTSDASVI